jgi:hypothetical protein
MLWPPGPVIGFTSKYVLWSCKGWTVLSTPDQLRAPTPTQQQKETS